MDPNTCLEEILDAMETNDEETVLERIKGLKAWMRKGGFSPAVSYSQLDFLLDFISDKFSSAQGTFRR